MTWREELRRVTLADGRKLVGASFRGVPFFVASADRSGGRRIVNHEFPGRDDNYVEDLGRHTRVFRVDGYVIGGDYLEQRDALLVALEDTAGPAQLVHPYYGVKTVVAGGFSVRESTAEGGMATFSVEFTEAPKQGIAPTTTPDLTGEVSTAADKAIAAAQKEFVATYDAKDLPTYALASAKTALGNATDALRSTLAPLISDTQELATFNGQVEHLTENTTDLVTTPADLLGEFQSAITALAITSGDAPGDVLDALLSAYAVDLGDAAPSTTATRERERANQVAIQNMLRQVLITEAARLAPTVPYDSIDAATTVRDALIDALDDLAAAATDDAYAALVDLRAAVARSVPADDVSARVTTIERRTAVPSLLLSYQLYGSVEEEADLIARNNITNPTFMAGSLRALSNG